MDRTNENVGSGMVPELGSTNQGSPIHAPYLWSEKLTKITVFNRNFEDAATVDIEDMPLKLAADLEEALTIIKVTAGQFYPELADFRDQLRKVLNAR